VLSPFLPPAESILEISGLKSPVPRLDCRYSRLNDGLEFVSDAIRSAAAKQSRDSSLLGFVGLPDALTEHGDLISIVLDQIYAN